MVIWSVIYYISVPLFLTLVSWLGKDSLMIILGVSSSAVCFFVISLATNTGEIFMSKWFEKYLDDFGV